MTVICPSRESFTEGRTLAPFDIPSYPELDLRSLLPAPLDGRAERRVEDPALDVGDGWTTIYNLSLGGMCIVTLRQLTVGDITTFDLQDRGTRRGFTLKGEVVWDQPVTEDLCKAGIRWIALDGEARDWLSHYLR